MAKQNGKKDDGKKEEGIAIIAAANILRLTLKIMGQSGSPYVQCAFSQKAKEKMLADMARTGAEKKAKSARPPRNYDEDFEGAQHKSAAGWNGIPCQAFRTAMVDACRTVNMMMTKAKMAITAIVPDGIDARDGTPLVRIYTPTPTDPDKVTLKVDGVGVVTGVPERSILPVRNDNGSTDLRVRPMWREWSANVTVEFDADMITAESVVNLLDRAGRQVGVGEGRPFSKKSCGMGWGRFTVEATIDERAA